jgi:hypothetical protein
MTVSVAACLSDPFLRNERVKGKMWRVTCPLLTENGHYLCCLTPGSRSGLHDNGSCRPQYFNQLTRMASGGRDFEDKEVQRISKKIGIPREVHEKLRTAGHDPLCDRFFGETNVYMARYNSILQQTPKQMRLKTKSLNRDAHLSTPWIGSAVFRRISP